MRKSAQKLSIKGFTLVELLVVIAIIAVLAAVVVLIINPLELTKRSRDAARLTDLANLQQAINVAVQEATGSSATNILCNGAAYPCGGSAGGGNSNQSDPIIARKADGTGWVKVNLGAQKSVSVPTLPVDQTNSPDYHYTYCADNNAWEINAVLESDQLKVKMERDGGDENQIIAGNATSAKYEVGSNLTLIRPTGGSCTY